MGAKSLEEWHTICVTAQVVEEPGEDAFAAAVDLFKVLADPTRLRIIWALLHSEHSVNELAHHVGVKPTTVSQQLAKLRLARLVRTRRDGNHIFYALENDHIEAVAQQALLQADHLTGGATHHRRGRATA